MAETAKLGGSRDRHRALADGSRLALLRVLEASTAPLDAHLLAERVGLHLNTVRWHLGILVNAGLVSDEVTPSGGRGRPRHTYRLVPGALEDRPGGFRLLSELLIQVVERGPGSDLDATIEDVGRIRGRTLVRPRLGGKRTTPREATEEIVRLLETFGFQPSLQEGSDDQPIAMKPCPFGEIAAQHSGIVCQFHLGLIRGALETLHAPVEATALEPFVRPDLCIARLRALGGGAEKT